MPGWEQIKSHGSDYMSLSDLSLFQLISVKKDANRKGDFTLESTCAILIAKFNEK